MNYCDRCARERNYPVRPVTHWGVCELCGCRAVLQQSSRDLLRERDAARDAKRQEGVA